ncbi:MAG: hypothetical protein WBE99_20435, partial [Xanthobacteraceae bacterium]
MLSRKSTRTHTARGALPRQRKGYAAALLLLGLYLPPVRHAIHGLRTTVAGAGLLVGPLGAA